MNQLRQITNLHGVRVASQAAVRPMREGYRSMVGTSNPAVVPFPSRDTRPGSIALPGHRNRPYRRRLAGSRLAGSRLAILPGLTILSRWSLAAGSARLEATRCPGSLARAQACSQALWQGPGTERFGNAERNGTAKAAGRPTTETTITGA